LALPALLAFTNANRTYGGVRATSRPNGAFAADEA
jgi:hypothetical protein